MSFSFTNIDTKDRPKIIMTYFDSEELELLEPEDEYQVDIYKNNQDRPIIKMVYFYEDDENEDDEDEDEEKMIKTPIKLNLIEKTKIKKLDFLKLTLKQWQNTEKNINDLIVNAVPKNKINRTKYPKGFNINFIYSNYKNFQIGTHKKTVLCAVLENNEKRKKYIMKFKKK